MFACILIYNKQLHALQGEVLEKQRNNVKFEHMKPIQTLQKI